MSIENLAPNYENLNYEQHCFCCFPSVIADLLTTSYIAPTMTAIFVEDFIFALGLGIRFMMEEVWTLRCGICVHTTMHIYDLDLQSLSRERTRQHTIRAALPRHLWKA